MRTLTLPRSVPSGRSHNGFHESIAFAAAVARARQLATGATAQETKVAIGISGWTGFAPLTLAKEAGIFKKNGIDATITKIPQASRHLAIASGSIQCAATTVETWIIWNANGVATKQLFQLDKSYGADGMVVRNNIGSIKDLKGKTVAASAPGTAPYFALAWFLKKNGMTVKDVTVVNMEPGPAAQAFIAGQNDAAMTYEPYLGQVRDKKEAGKIIATTLDYPMVMDTFGCTPKFIADNKAAIARIVEELLRGARHDRQGAGEGQRHHGRRREADRRAVRRLVEVPALAGPGREQEVLRRRHPGVLEGSGRPADSNSASSSRPRRSRTSSTRASSSRLRIGADPPGLTPSPTAFFLSERSPVLLPLMGRG